MKMVAAQTLRFLASIAPQGSCSRKPPRRARSPALHCSRERTVSHKTLPPARPGGGPMQSIGPYAGSEMPAYSPGSTARLPCIVRRTFMPAGQGLRKRKPCGFWQALLRKALAAASPRGGRDRPPYILAVNGRRQKNRHPPARPCGGPLQGTRRPGECAPPPQISPILINSLESPVMLVPYQTS